MELAALIREASSRPGPVVVLTGAGISAESGIPTFRGSEGYWTVGSRNYRPMELATAAAFARVPGDVWGWYLHRRSVCHAARPNAAHEALVRLEGRLADRFLLVTQNVDGLHLRAGSSPERTHQIHGNLDFMRCAADCGPEIESLPAELGESWERGRVVGEAEWALLRCSRCGGRSRPHVLWFDEYYDEPRFRFESSLGAATAASLLVVVGSSGTTNLPTRMCLVRAELGVPIVVVDTEPTPFSELAERSRAGAFVVGRATEVLPPLLERIGG